MNCAQEILFAAQRLFLSQGFAAMPMRQIARELGITCGAIYNHYPGKDQLFLYEMILAHILYTLITALPLAGSSLPMAQSRS
jgi:AcrR family transcriptional regulator